MQPSLKKERKHHAMVVQKGSNDLLVIGGYNDFDGYLNNVEKFGNNEWVDFAPLNHKRSSHSAIAVDGG